MKDMIYRADALEQMAQAECGSHYAYCEKDNCSCSYIGRLLDIPSIEAVQVVRCKDCKHRETDDCPMYWMEWFSVDEGDGYFEEDFIIHDYTRDDGYCHWGERNES